MGTSSLFWTRLRALYNSVPPPKDAVYAIDASVFLYRASCAGRLGYDAFEVNPSDTERVNAIVERYADSILSAVQALEESGVSKTQIVWFFEGHTDKSRHLYSQRHRETRLCRALRVLFGQERLFLGQRCRNGRDAISKVYGRPPWWLTLRIAHQIKDKGYAVSAVEKQESDHRITQWAWAKSLSGCRVIVLSVDSDYLAYSVDNSVSELGMPMHGGKELRLIKKADVLETSQLTPFQLMLAFSIAGSDNIATHIEGVGWYRSRMYAQKWISPDMMAENFLGTEDPLPHLASYKNATVDLVKQLGGNIERKLEDFGWLKQDVEKALAISLPEIGAASIPTQSAKHFFAFETSEKGELKHLRAARCVLNTDRQFIQPTKVQEVDGLIEQHKDACKGRLAGK